MRYSTFILPVLLFIVGYGLTCITPNPEGYLAFGDFLGAMTIFGGIVWFVIESVLFVNTPPQFRGYTARQLSKKFSYEQLRTVYNTMSAGTGAPTGAGRIGNARNFAELDDRLQKIAQRELEVAEQELNTLLAEHR